MRFWWLLLPLSRSYSHELSLDFNLLFFEHVLMHIVFLNLFIFFILQQIDHRLVDKGLKTPLFLLLITKVAHGLRVGFF